VSVRTDTVRTDTVRTDTVRTDSVRTASVLCTVLLLHPAEGVGGVGTLYYRQIPNRHPIGRCGE
jgi:hypothetical protein